MFQSCSGSTEFAADGSLDPKGDIEGNNKRHTPGHILDHGGLLRSSAIIFPWSIGMFRTYLSSGSLSHPTSIPSYLSPAFRIWGHLHRAGWPKVNLILVAYRIEKAVHTEDEGCFLPEIMEENRADW